MAKVRPGDSFAKLTARHHNDTVDVIRRDKQRRASSLAGGVAFRAESWLGIITNTGPAAEDDYTDSRYWVQRVACANSSGDATTLITVDEWDPAVAGDYTGIWVTATNLSEQPFYIASGFTSHTLRTGTLVRVMTCYDAQTPSLKRYLFFENTGAEKNIFVVRVWQDGGTTDGDEDTQCDRTYAVTTLEASLPDGTDGVLLGEDMTPVKRRPASGKLSVPPDDGDGVIGLGFWLSGGAPGTIFQLYDANETLAVQECEFDAV